MVTHYDGILMDESIESLYADDSTRRRYSFRRKPQKLTAISINDEPDILLSNRKVKDNSKLSLQHSPRRSSISNLNGKFVSKQQDPSDDDLPRLSSQSKLLFELYNEVTQTFDELNEVKDELDYRKDLSRRIDASNHNYIKIYKHMLYEITRVFRERSESTKKDIDTLSTENSLLRDQVVMLRESIQLHSQNSMEIREEIALVSDRDEIKTKTIHEQSKTIDELHRTLYDDKHKINTLTNELNELRNNSKELENIRKFTAEQIYIAATRFREKYQKEYGNDDEMSTFQQILKAAENTYHYPKTTSSTQTLVDEHGLWDKQDGWILPISNSRLARQRWRLSINFASCPSCRGVPKFFREIIAMKGSKLKRNAMQTQLESTSWVIPDDLIHFISNLPRAIQSEKIGSLSWLLGEVYAIWSRKFYADEVDQTLGYTQQNLVDFLIESYLLTEKSRYQAELGIFRLLVALEAYAKQHIMIYTFCRFLGLLREKKQPRDQPKTIISKLHTLPLEAPRGFTSTSDSLSPVIMSTYLFTRECLLHEYSGSFARKLFEAKRDNPYLNENFDKLVIDDAKSDIKSLPAHICVDDQKILWIPLDRATRVLHAILSFTNYNEFTERFAIIERNARILTDIGTLTTTEGMNTFIREMTRLFMQCRTENGRDLTWKEVIKLRKTIPVSVHTEIPSGDPKAIDSTKMKVFLVNLDACLQMVVELLLEREKLVEEKLHEIFISGDVNGDNVLSFEEFRKIGQTVAPDFHERRLLRMFREALLEGDDGEKIGSEAFIAICKKHDLVHMVRHMKFFSF